MELRFDFPCSKCLRGYTSAKRYVLYVLFLI